MDLEGYGRIIDGWRDQPPTTYDSAVINLPAGYRNVTVIWYENGVGAYVRFWWDMVDPCTNSAGGTNQLKGCLFDGTTLNPTQDGGNAPDGILAANENPATALWQDWEQTSPNDFVGADQFSARWKGTFNFKKGKYTFKIGSDDGARLKVDNNPITLTRTGSNPPDTNSWVPQSWDGADKWQAEIPFNIDRTNVPMELEYYEDGGNAKITLYWTFTPPPAPTSAWIYVDGDVHSNGRIRIAQ